MGRKALNVMIDEKLYNYLKSYADEKGISIRQALEEILADYSQPKPKSSPKGIILGKEQDVILQHPSKCALCGRELREGYHVKFFDNLGHVCLRCYYTKFYAKALADKYLKKKELEATIKALRKEADRLAVEIEKKRLALDINTILADIQQVLETIRRARDYTMIWNDRAEEILDKLEDIDNKLSAVTLVIDQELKDLIKPRPARYRVRETRHLT